jgi:hypothetical protein
MCFYDILLRQSSPLSSLSHTHSYVLSLLCHFFLFVLLFLNLPLHVFFSVLVSFIVYRMARNIHDALVCHFLFYLLIAMYNTSHFFIYYCSYTYGRHNSIRNNFYLNFLFLLLLSFKVKVLSSITWNCFNRL